MTSSIVVVGGSLAGLRAVETLRHEGFEGDLVVVGAEPHRPYDRPPLSKQVLAGKWELDRIGLESAPDDDGAVPLADWVLGRRAVALDLAARALELDDGSRLRFDGLVIATGAVVRTLPGTPPDMAGIHTLRTIDDCLAVRAELDATPGRVVVVGAGFIGAEVAATCRGRGLDVTLLEALPVPLVRGLGPRMGAVCADVHRDHGVDVRLGTGVEGFDGGARVERVQLSDGTTVDADVVVVGVGVRPATDWLEASGLTLDNGVVCDATCLAAPGVVAAGDVARWENQRFGTMRVEHWENAQMMGTHAAQTLLAHLAGKAAEPYQPVPWFWSDQYDRKIQLAGHPGPDDEVEVIDGSVDERRFVALYGREGRLTGVLGFNRPRLVIEYQRLIADGASWEAALNHKLA